MDAHEREAAGAAAGMRELYGWQMPAVGDWVSGSSGGKSWAGRVIEITGDDLRIDVADGYLIVPATHVGRS